MAVAECTYTRGTRPALQRGLKPGKNAGCPAFYRGQSCRIDIYSPDFMAKRIKILDVPCPDRPRSHYDNKHLILFR
jgi:hypothetical protein